MKYLEPCFENTVFTFGRHDLLALKEHSSSPKTTMTVSTFLSKMCLKSCAQGKNHPQKYGKKTSAILCRILKITNTHSIILLYNAQKKVQKAQKAQKKSTKSTKSTKKKHKKHKKKVQKAQKKSTKSTKKCFFYYL